MANVVPDVDAIVATRAHGTHTNLDVGDLSSSIANITSDSYAITIANLASNAVADAYASTIANVTSDTIANVTSDTIADAITVTVAGRALR